MVFAKTRTHRAARTWTYVNCHCEERSDANRHCERSEAIHSQSNGDNGLLRRFAPRNDGFNTPGVSAIVQSSSSAKADDPVFQSSFDKNREAAAYWIPRLRGV